MKRISCLAFLCLAALSSAAAEDRVGVVDNSDEIKIKGTVESLEKAFDSEDVGGYADCFKESSRKSVRRKTALLFASEICSIDIEEIHIIDIGSEEAEVAVRYSLAGSGGPCCVISTVKFVREDDRWLVSSESLVSKTPVKAVSYSANKAPPKAANEEWDPFNPDPNRIPAGLHHLMGDIGIQPGMGCAGGNCVNGRCVQ